MKIEIELEDNFYHALREMIGDVDIGVALSEMLKYLVMIYGSDPERFMETYENIESEEAKSLRSQMKGLTHLIFDKARKKNKGER